MLLNNNESSIPPSEVRGYPDMIHYAPATQKPGDINFSEHLIELAKDGEVEFYLTSEHLEVESGSARPYDTVGETMKGTQDKAAIIAISYEILQPLLNLEITRAERTLCHFRVATTIVHELMVRNPALSGPL